ncbi:MAG: hypothetical protein CMM92_02180 [Rickettsiales bacterium]|nr:hypothetical protein [Rickettsiales bacterium]
MTLTLLKNYIINILIKNFHMLNLSLIRHARTDLDNSIRDDMSRPISLQGIDETKKVCEFLKKKKII